jgi:chromosomal replication initiator protein
LPTTIKRIIAATAREFRITSAELVGNSRAYRIAKPRAIAVLLARQLTKASFKQIGIALGGRDHSACVTLKKRGHDLIRDNDTFERYLRIRDAARSTL